MAARPPGNLYRFQKAVRRNKIAFTAAAIVAVVLVTGAVVSTWQAIRATLAKEQALSEKRRADEEAAKSRQVASFLKDMLNGVEPSVAAGRDTILLREILDRTAERVAAELKDQPLVAAELLNIVGRVYQELSEDDKAERTYRQALALIRTTQPGGHPEEIISLYSLAQVLTAHGYFSAGEASARDALATSSRLLPEGHRYVVSALHELAVTLQWQEKLEEAEIVAKKALAAQRCVCEVAPDASVETCGRVFAAGDCRRG